MRQAEPGSGWPDLLDAVIADGGVRRLRAALVRHVATHGASIKAGWVDRDLDALIAALRRIRTAERALGWQETAESATARDYLTLVRKSARELRDASYGLADTAEIEKVIAVEAIDQAYQWPVWGSVLDRIEPRHNFVVPSTGSHDDTRHDRTEPLQDSFAELVGDLIVLATNGYHQLAQQWLDSLDEATEQLRSSWGDGSMDTDLAGLLRKIQKDPEKAAVADTAIAEMRGVRALIDAEIETAMNDLEKRSADPDTFPLRPRHHRPWAAVAGAVASDETAPRHQSVVLRMRGNVADAAAEVVSELVRGMAVNLAESVRRRAARIVDTVPPPPPAATTGRAKFPPRPKPGEEPVAIVSGEVAELLTSWGVS
jgi:hypothetical protein